MRSQSASKEPSNSLSPEEQTIRNIYLDEFAEIFPDILQFPSGKFISHLFKRVRLVLQHQFNGRYSQYLPKIEKFIIEHHYPSQYTTASNSMKQIKAKLESSTASTQASLLYNGNDFIKHCKQTKNAIHICGNKLLSNKSYEPNASQVFLFCVKCNQIYKETFIRLICQQCNHCEYYSRLLSQDEIDGKKLQLATWEKYHCGAIINDVMKCIKCKEPFYYNSNKQMLVCVKCNFTIEPFKINWTCIFCKSDFKSNVKAYNNLEFKLMKTCVKETLLNKVKAFPTEKDFSCGCVIDINSYVFYHKTGCSGQMLLGELNKKKILVCSLCHSLSFLDNFIWTCPICGSKGKNDMTNRGVSEKKLNRFNSGNRLLNAGESTPSREKGIIRYNSAQKGNDDNNNNNNSRVRKISIDGLLKFNNALMQNSPGPKAKANIPPFPMSSYKRNGNDIDNKENLSINTLSRATRKQNGNNNNHVNNLHSGICISKKNSCENIIEQCPSNYKNICINPSSYSAYSSRRNSQEKTRRSPSLSGSNSNNTNTNSNMNSILPNTLPVFDSDSYDIKAKIGEGTFGKIYLVEKGGMQYAMKKIVGTTNFEISSLRHEYEILSFLSTNRKINIINIYGTQSKRLDRTTYVMYILMELAISDWEKDIMSRGKALHYYSERELIYILKSLIKTFSQLQAENVSHRDIKPQNILICQNNIFKVADFGEAKELLKNKANTDNQTIRGTELFMSPILFRAVRNRRCAIVRHNTFKSDVFSLGLCMLYAATLTFNSIYDIRELVSSIEIESVIKKYINGRYSEVFRKIIMKMLNYNEKERSDFIEMEKIIHKEYP